MSETVEATPISESFVMLLLYSEWLDVSGLLKTPRQSGDKRSHADLVSEFVKRGAAERLAQHRT